MRGVLMVAILVTFAAVTVAPPPAPAKPDEQPADHLVSPEEHLADDHGENFVNGSDAHDEQGDEHGEGQGQEEDEENVFASVELAATNADLAIKLMKRALSVLLESSASAMEHTEALLKSGVVSVNSVAQGASAAAKQLGVTPEIPAPKQAPQQAPQQKPPPPKKQSSWSWWS